jgi:2'-5' RNA ligase
MPTPENPIGQDYYNIALYPRSEQLIDDCVQFARANCADRAEQYLLGTDARGDRAFPHITLCQMQLQRQDVELVWSKVSALCAEPVPVQFHHIYIMPASRYENKYYVGLVPLKNSRLIELQTAVFETLSVLGITSLTAAENYFPHLTWALCHGQEPSIKKFPQATFWQETYIFMLSLGRSDQHGVYHERLLPKQKEEEW